MGMADMSLVIVLLTLLPWALSLSVDEGPELSQPVRRDRSDTLPPVKGNDLIVLVESRGRELERLLLLRLEIPGAGLWHSL